MNGDRERLQLPHLNQEQITNLEGFYRTLGDGALPAVTLKDITCDRTTCGDDCRGKDIQYCDGRRLQSTLRQPKPWDFVPKQGDLDLPWA
jgi:hypothetical protein